MRFFLADLHVHTCLSPCAELEMLPKFIVERAQALGLHVIAVTDHNSAENAAAVINAARGTGITVLPGMEVQTREEVHILALFDTLEQVASWQEQVYASLPPLKNDGAVFGEQVLLDADGEPVGYLDRLLLTSTTLSVEQIVQRVSGLNGLCIPAHVDRPAYSIISNLGFIPPELDVVGVEISHNVGPLQARERFPQLKRYGLLGSSDAHRLRDMGRRTTLKMAEATVAELSLALAGRDGREVWVDGVSSVRVPLPSPSQGPVLSKAKEEESGVRAASPLPALGEESGVRAASPPLALGEGSGVRATSPLPALGEGSGVRAS